MQRNERNNNAQLFTFRTTHCSSSDIYLFACLIQTHGPYYKGSRITQEHNNG